MAVLVFLLLLSATEDVGGLKLTRRFRVGTEAEEEPAAATDAVVVVLVGADVGGARFGPDRLTELRAKGGLEASTGDFAGANERGGREGSGNSFREGTGATGSFRPTQGCAAASPHLSIIS